MFINQQVLFTIIEKYVQFRVLIPLANRIKYECYRDLDVLIRNYNRAGFSVKCIECDGNLKSIMDEVSDEMRI